MDEDRKTYKKVLEDVERGDECAKTDLAWFMLSGCGGAKVNAEAAVALLEERVKEKDEEAMWMLGLCVEYGRGIKQDIERAEGLYEQSGACGSTTGAFLAKKVERWHHPPQKGSGIKRVYCLC